jgi:hypothetical protein
MAVSSASLRMPCAHLLEADFLVVGQGCQARPVGGSGCAQQLHHLVDLVELALTRQQRLACQLLMGCIELGINGVDLNTCLNT